MCGICAVFGLQVNFPVQHESFDKIRHRGPDAWRIEYDCRMKYCCLSFHRLAIVDSLYGMQPMKVHFNPHLSLLCNGEIYNCKRIFTMHDDLKR